MPAGHCGLLAAVVGPFVLRLFSRRALALARLLRIPLVARALMSRAVGQHGLVLTGSFTYGEEVALAEIEATKLGEGPRIIAH